MLRLVGELVVLAGHPSRAVGEPFFLPDGHDGLDAVHRLVARLKGRHPVRRRHGYHQADVSDVHPTRAVGDGDVLDTVVGAQVVTDLAQLLEGHHVVGFVFQPGDGLAAEVVAGGAQERNHRAVSVRADRVGNRRRVQGFVGKNNHHSATSTDRGNQADLVAGVQELVIIGILGVHRHHNPHLRRRQPGVIGAHGVGKVADSGPVRHIHRHHRSAGPLPVQGKETNIETHNIWDYGRAGAVVSTGPVVKSRWREILRHEHPGYAAEFYRWFRISLK